MVKTIPDSDYFERIHRLQAKMAERDLDAVLCYADTGVYENVFYLSKYWPLFEVVEGKWILNYEPKKKLPIEDFLRPQGRFKHLFKKENEYLIEEFQKEVDRRWDELLFKCSK